MSEILAGEDRVRAFQGQNELPGDCHPDIRLITDYWRSIHPEAGLPGRQHFDPVAVPPRLLPSIRLLDVVGDPPRFRLRLMGTKMVAAVGQDFTGCWLDEVFNQFGESSAFLGLDDVVKTGQINWRRGHPALLYGKEFMIIERV